MAEASGAEGGSAGRWDDLRNKQSWSVGYWLGVAPGGGTNSHRGLNKTAGVSVSASGTSKPHINPFNRI